MSQDAFSFDLHDRESYKPRNREIYLFLKKKNFFTKKSEMALKMKILRNYQIDSVRRMLF